LWRLRDLYQRSIDQYVLILALCNHAFRQSRISWVIGGRLGRVCAWVRYVVFLDLPALCILDGGWLSDKRGGVHIQFRFCWYACLCNCWSWYGKRGWVLVVIFDRFIDFLDFNVVLFVLYLLSVVLADFLSVISLLLRMIERTYLAFVTSRAVAINSLVLVWVIQSLHSRVALVAKQPLRALLPTGLGAISLALHIVTVLRNILEDLRRPSKVPHVMGVNTAL
jgi:hypothetical protein